MTEFQKKNDTALPANPPCEMDNDQYTAEAAEVVRFARDMLASNNFQCAEIPKTLAHVPGITELHTLLWTIREMASALAKGDMGCTSTVKGFVPDALQTLQADLCHLFRQTQYIANGEYQHRLSFPGDLAKAFNGMAEKLELNFAALTKISEEYKDLSARDFLTGLYNRRAFLVLASRALENTIRNRRPAVLIMADIDHFKEINDTYGHTCGDDVLHSFAEAMIASLRSQDICCRYGGEEFLILLPGVDLAIGYAIAERLRKNIQKMQVVTHGQIVQITASFGVSEFLGLQADTDFVRVLTETVERADKCLYTAKEHGRNTTIVEGLAGQKNLYREE